MWFRIDHVVLLVFHEVSNWKVFWLLGRLVVGLWQWLLLSFIAVFIYTVWFFPFFSFRFMLLAWFSSNLDSGSILLMSFDCIFLAPILPVWLFFAFSFFLFQFLCFIILLSNAFVVLTRSFFSGVFLIFFFTCCPFVLDCRWVFIKYWQVFPRFFDSCRIFLGSILLLIQWIHRRVFILLLEIDFFSVREIFFSILLLVQFFLAVVFPARIVTTTAIACSLVTPTAF